MPCPSYTRLIRSQPGFKYTMVGVLRRGAELQSPNNPGLPVTRGPERFLSQVCISNHIFILILINSPVKSIWSFWRSICSPGALCSCLFLSKLLLCRAWHTPAEISQPGPRLAHPGSSHWLCSVGMLLSRGRRGFPAGCTSLLSKCPSQRTARPASAEGAEMPDCDHRLENCGHPGKTPSLTSGPDSTPLSPDAQLHFPPGQAKSS